MGDDLNLLVTVYQHHELGDSLVRCALKCKRWDDFDHEYLMENREEVARRLPLHVRSIGPVVEIERIFEISGDEPDREQREE